MTAENWPPIGPAGPEGACMNYAQPGSGTPAACTGGELCAAWITDAPLPGFAKSFSLPRYDDTEPMALLSNSNRCVP